MVVARTLKGRKTHGAVVVYAEVLFKEGADIPRWKKRLSARVRARASDFAPRNKRPRWAHYGPPLHSTMRSNTRTRMTAGGGYVSSGVGSTAHYSVYVDQGTKDHTATILPPWEVFSPTLYEAAWNPHGAGAPLGPIKIRGIEPTLFMEKGLDAALISMKLRAHQFGGNGGINWDNSYFLMHTPFFAGNTPVDLGFKASRAEWREWRNEAWIVRNENRRANRRRAARNARTEERRRKWREERRKNRERNKQRERDRQKQRDAERAKRLRRKAERAAFKYMAAWKDANPGMVIVSWDRNGFRYKHKDGFTVKSKTWPYTIGDMFIDAEEAR